jgi:polyribonucleotide nucleotidyltransferase
MLDFGAVVEYLEVQEMKYYSRIWEAWERTENVSTLWIWAMFSKEILRYGSKTRKVSRKALMPRPPREERKE